jgi:hypothetical protein
LLLGLWNCAWQGAEIPGEREIRQVGNDLVAALNQEAIDVRRFFAPGFLKELENRQLPINDIFRSLRQSHGRAEAFRLKAVTAPYIGEVEFIYSGGVRKPARLVLDPQPPHAIVGIEFRAAVREDDTFDQVLQDLRRLPGKAGLALRQLAPQARTLAEHEPDTPLAVASCMKLVVLAALAEEVADGRRNWADVVRVRKDWAALPAGLVQDWPDGSPITLHTLATLMISRSDNTAADHLIRFLGRERVQETEARLGLTGARLNRPFLLTAEMSKLKLVLGPAEQQAYSQADAAQRSRMLDTVVARSSLARPRSLGPPRFIESIEWFYSPNDLIRVLDNLRSSSQSPTALPLLGIQRGVSVDESDWTYVGYKGGAEPGVVALTMLLEDRRGRWFALAIGWNDTARDVDRARLVAITQRLLHLVVRPPDQQSGQP